MKASAFVSSLRKASVALFLALFAVVPAAWASKYASIVVDIDSAKVLHDKDADELRHPASLTKVMTLYIVFDALDAGTLKLTDRMPVSKFASQQQPSKLGVKAGGTIKVEDAIRALVTKSANDVAVVFAEKLGGSETKFATKMNAKAKALGLQNTVFKNASGLPNAAQVTTARDMAKLAEAVFRDHKDRYNYFSLPSFTWNKRKYANHNTLLEKVQGVDGIKTGFTNASGYNLMASAQREGHRVIAVMLGGSTGRSRDQHVADLLEQAFLTIKGVPAKDLEEINQRIAMGETRELGADDLAAVQLARLGAGEDDDNGSTEDEDGKFETASAEVGASEGDAEPAATLVADAQPDRIGNLIESTRDAIGSLIENRAPLAAVQAAQPVGEQIVLPKPVFAEPAPSAPEGDPVGIPKAPVFPTMPAATAIQAVPQAPAAAPDVRPTAEPVAAPQPAAPVQPTPAVATPAQPQPISGSVVAFSADPAFVSGVAASQVALPAVR